MQRALHAARLASPVLCRRYVVTPLLVQWRPTGPGVKGSIVGAAVAPTIVGAALGAAVGATVGAVGAAVGEAVGATVSQHSTQPLWVIE